MTKSPPNLKAWAVYIRSSTRKRLDKRSKPHVLLHSAVCTLF
jgi:hypothetical protein